MKKNLFGILFSAVFVLALASLGFAGMTWKTNAIQKINVSLNYVDPSTGAQALKNYSGVGLNYLEIDQDDNNHQYVFLHTQNYSDMEVELSTVGGGLSTAAKGTQMNGTWREGLNDNIINFSPVEEMQLSDIKAVVMNGTTSTNIDACNLVVNMTAAGMLTLGGTEKAPARVTVSASAKGVPGVMGIYSSTPYEIGKDFKPDAPQINGPPIAANLSQSTLFGAPPLTVDVVGLSPNYNPMPTVNIPSGGGALNGTSIITSNKIVYTPSADFSGTDTFVYQLQSGLYQSNTATVKVAVGPRPHAVLQNYSSIPKDSTTATVCTPAADWKTNANITLSVPAKSDAGGITSVNASGNFLYTPPAGFDGTDSVTYTLTDKLNRTITGTAIFGVTPHAVGDSITYSVATGWPPTTTTNLLSNDQGDGLIVVGVFQVTTPSNTYGMPLLTGDAITYTPAIRQSGRTEYFGYTVMDASGKISSAIVTVNEGP